MYEVSALKLEVKDLEPRDAINYQPAPDSSIFSPATENLIGSSFYSKVVWTIWFLSVPNQDTRPVMLLHSIQMAELRPKIGA